MTEQLTDFERDVLRAANGETVEGLDWGAAMSAALDCLKDAGYLKMEPHKDGVAYVPTKKGRKALKDG